jgi:hypothetical protein
MRQNKQNYPKKHRHAKVKLLCLLACLPAEPLAKEGG